MDGYAHALPWTATFDMSQGRIKPQIGKILHNHGEGQIAAVKEMLLCDFFCFDFLSEKKKKKELGLFHMLLV